MRNALVRSFMAMCLFTASLLTAESPQAATLVVTTTSEADAADGACSLREAIIAINAGASHNECAGSGFGNNDRIEFDIPGEGVRSIVMSSNFLPIVRPVVIDGLSQPGASCDAWPPTLRIELDGQGNVLRGLIFNPGSGGSLARGLVIGGMTGGEDNFTAGIMLVSDGNRVECSYLGMRADGSTANPNRRGIDINSASDSIIGTDGTQPALGRRNLVSGNLFSGVHMRGISPSRNVVGGNYIGVDAGGTQARSNHTGVSVNGTGGGNPPAQDNVIGYDGSGSPEFARNIISGNASGSPSGPGAGIVMETNVQRTRIAGNFIGLSADGSAAVPNNLGITIGSNASVQNNLIGFPSAQPLAVSGNVISGNTLAGILVNGANGTDLTFIVGNLIGTLPSGAPGLPNAQFGIMLSNDTRALVHGNVISGHNPGIRLFGSSGRPFPRFLNGEALPTGGAPLDSSGNCIAGNTAGVALLVNGGTPTTITFLDNWWGAANGPSGAGGGSGDSISSGIDFSPFLTVAPAGCAITLVADLAVDVSGLPSPLVAGGSYTAELGAQNLGPDAVDSATLSFTLPGPAGIFELPGSCTENAGQVNCELGPIASAGSASVSIPFQLPPDAAGSFATTVSVTSPVLDPNAGNNSQIVSRDIVRIADLAIAFETEVAVAVEGEPLFFRLRANNAGPSHAANAEVALDLPEGVTDLVWTCIPTAGADCAGSGADELLETVQLAPGSELVYDLGAMIGAVESIALEATLIPAKDTGDPFPDNNLSELALAVLKPEIFRDGFETDPDPPD